MPPRLLPWTLLLLLAGCQSSSPLYGGSDRMQSPLATTMVMGFEGRYVLSCDAARPQQVLEINADGSASLDGRPLLDADHPGSLVLEGNAGSPAHAEAGRIGFGDDGRPGILQVPAYPATVSLTLQGRAGVRHSLTVTVVAALDGSSAHVGMADADHVQDCRVLAGKVSLLSTVLATVPDLLLQRLTQTQAVVCRTGLASKKNPGTFAIRDGVVTFPDAQQWPLASGPAGLSSAPAGPDWNFQLQDEASFGPGGYRLLLDSVTTPRNMLGREVSFDRDGRVQQLHYLAADGQGVDCQAD